MDTHFFPFADNTFSCAAHGFTGRSAGTTILTLPAIGIPSYKYQKFIDECLKSGFNVIIADYPGNGQSTPRPSRSKDYGYQDLICEFVPELITLSKKLFPGSKTVIFGHSIGGHVATLYSSWINAAHVPIISLAGGNICYKHWKGISKFKTPLAAAMFFASTAIFGYLPGKQLGFGRYEARTMIQQWARVAFSGNYSHIPFSRSAEHSAQLRGLFMGIDQDSFAPEPSVNALLQIFPGKSEYKKLKPPRPLSENPHSSWLKAPETVVKTFSPWLQDKK